MNYVEHGKTLQCLGEIEGACFQRLKAKLLLPSFVILADLGGTSRLSARTNSRAQFMMTMKPVAYAVSVAASRSRTHATCIQSVRMPACSFRCIRFA